MSKAPFASLRFAPAAVEVERRAGGVQVLRSPQPLQPYARCLGEHLERWARAAPDRCFLAERAGADWRRLTFSEALTQARAIGAALLARGLSAERPAMVLSDNSIEHALLMLGAMHVGVPVAPVSPAYSLMSKDCAKVKGIAGLLKPGLVYAADGAKFAGVLGSVDFGGAEIVLGANAPAGMKSTPFSDLLQQKAGVEVDRAFAAVGPDTIAKFLFTSGSTGEPKGVINTQRMLCSNQQAVTQLWPFLDEKPPVILDWLPWNHTFGANHNFNIVLANGGTLYIDDGKPVPGLIEKTVANLREVSPTIYFNVPRGYDALIPFLEKDDVLRKNFFRDLQLIFYAAAALPQNLWEKLEDLSIRERGKRTVMVSSWGATETAPMVTSVHFEIDRAGVIGLPAPGTEVKLVPNENKLELRVRGPNVTPGYWKRPDLTQAAFDEEGFYRIGDAGRFADPNDPARGIEFDGRIAEDFKLMSGVWVHVGALRVKALAALAPLAQDIVVAGHDREEAGFLVFANPAGCRGLCPELPADAPLEQVLADARVTGRLKAGMAMVKQEGGGSSTFATRALLMAEPPSIDANEITDKGYINQRAVLTRRAALVERLYAESPDAAVISLKSQSPRDGDKPPQHGGRRPFDRIYIRSHEMSEVVNVSMQGEIAVVTVDSPPVNTLSRDVRAGLKECFASLRGRPEVKAVVLACAGKTFLSGGDMREFETGILEPGYHEVLRLIEDSTVPVVAALYGTVMGGGVETAIACHYRVAQEGTKFGLPEITLGIIPGAGGTQRMPRLIGLAPALDMMLSGKPLTAAQAKEVSLVDTVVEADVTGAAIAYARELVATGKGPRRTRERAVAGSEMAGETIAARRAQLGKTFKNRNSPNVLLDAVQAAVDKPFDEGIAFERSLSSEVERAVEGRAFRHLFFSERELRKIPGLPADVKSRPIKKVGIVGAGTMGGGISMCFANAGIPVTIVDAAQANLDRGLATIRKNYERSVTRGSLKPEQMEQRLALITPTLDYAALAAADLIVEAVFENMALKQEIFAKLDAVAKPGAILGTNTSTLDIDEIAAVTKRAQDVIGLHFFSPANVMQLLEIVQCAKTAPDVVMTALDVAKTIRKVGVVAKVCYGFIGNRMMDPYGREAERCVMEGATPEEVDGALEEFGMAMGILAVYDMAGIDIGHLTRVARAHLLPKDPTFYRPTALLTERGWLGQKSGRGYYRYDGADRKRTPDPEAIAMFAEEAKRLGVPQRKPSKQEIQERCLYAMINEGALLLEQGIAVRASDIDIVYASGYGFPRYRGGPMFYADTVGLMVIYDKIMEFQKTLDPQYWQPAPLLEKLARAGASFAQWQAEGKV